MQEHILVVGGAGYIGSHTIKELHKKGYSVVVLDNLSKGHKESIQAIDPNIPLIIGDLGDQDILNQIFNTYSISTVMHFAAFIEVGTSVARPDIYYDNNVVKVLTLLNTMRKHNVNNFVFSSTAATFGNPLMDKITEKHTQLPINPYGSSKLMVEQILKDYSIAFPEFHYCIFRYFNACGSDIEGTIGQSYRPTTHLISIILETASGNRPSVSIFGTDYDTADGTCIRDYIHVTDLAKAHILGMQRMLKEKINDDFNLGTGNGNSVKEVISLAKEITGIDFNVNFGDRRPGDPAMLVSDPTKANTILNWRTEYNLHDMISSAWHWEQHKIY